LNNGKIQKQQTLVLSSKQLTTWITNNQD